MARSRIDVYELDMRICNAWDKRWFLLTCGDFGKNDFNTMTVSWGSLGIMWDRPFVQVVVRPTRYTFEFLERYGSFTLCAFPRHLRDNLLLLGSKSGRDSDKISEAGLTPITSSVVSAPAFDEAELVLECRKMYWDDMEPDRFIDSSIIDKYPKKDYHRIYFGEILAVSGEEHYRVPYRNHGTSS